MHKVSLISVTAALAALGAAVPLACSSPSSSDTSPPRSPPARAAAPEENAMSPIDRYRDYLARIGADRSASVVDNAALRLGDWHFFNVEGDARGTTRAAASSLGVVGGGRAPGDAWFAFLHVADAAALACRIAWLESPSAGRGPGTVVVSGATPPAAKIDPRLWRAARPPALADAAGKRRFIAWLYASDSDEPFELIVTAPQTGSATIEAHPAHTITDVGNVADRARDALRDPDEAIVRWGLITVGRQRIEGAAPQVAALLTRPDAALRADAAVALATLRAPETVDALAAACTTETDTVARRMMLSALGNIGTAKAIAALVALRPRLTETTLRLDLVHGLARAAETTPGPARAALAAIAKDDADATVRQLAASYATP